MVTTNDGDLGVTVPSPGEFAVISTETIDGVIPESFSLETTDEGVIRASESPDGTFENPSESPECDSNSHAFLLGGNGKRQRWDGHSYWYINRATVPTSTVDQSNAVNAIRQAMTNITESRNDCGINDQVTASATYQGDTAKFAQVNSDGTKCHDKDGSSVVSFQPLTQKPGKPLNSLLGLRCQWGQAESAYWDVNESDVALDSSDRNWTTNINSSCSGSWDVQSVATHEFGHWFGLDHASEFRMTMYKSIPSCSDAKRSLGRGDIIGLRALYP